MLAGVDIWSQRLEVADGTMRGLLRITAPVRFGQRYLAPLVNDFLAHQNIRVELNVEMSRGALIDERLDLRCVLGHMHDRRLGEAYAARLRADTCASPD